MAPLTSALACMYACSVVSLCEPRDGSPLGSSVVDFPSQEYWNGLTFPSLGELPDPGIESTSLASPALADGFFTTRATWEAYFSPRVSTKSLVADITVANTVSSQNLPEALFSPGSAGYTGLSLGSENIVVLTTFQALCSLQALCHHPPRYSSDSMN